MPRSEILARYRRLRQISKRQHEAVLDIIAPSVLLDWARRLDLTEGKAIVLENDNEMTLPEDLAIYLPRPGRSHPLDRYARVARVAPGSDEAIVLAAMRRARFSLWRIERRHPTTGLILRDLLRGEETWLVDEAMEKNAPPGVEMAASPIPSFFHRWYRRRERGFCRGFGSIRAGASRWARRVNEAGVWAMCGRSSASCMGLTCMPNGSTPWPAPRLG